MKPSAPTPWGEQVRSWRATEESRTLRRFDEHESERVADRRIGQFAREHLLNQLEPRHPTHAFPPARSRDQRIARGRARSRVVQSLCCKSIFRSQSSSSGRDITVLSPGRPRCQPPDHIELKAITAAIRIGSSSRAVAHELR